MLIWPRSNSNLTGIPAILVTVLSIDRFGVKLKCGHFGKEDFLDCRMEGLVYGAEGSKQVSIRLEKKIENPTTLSAEEAFNSWFEAHYIGRYHTLSNCWCDFDPTAPQVDLGFM